MLQSSSDESEERENFNIYSHILLRICHWVIGGQRSMMFAPPLINAQSSNPEFLVLCPD